MAVHLHVSLRDISDGTDSYAMYKLNQNKLLMRPEAPVHEVKVAAQHVCMFTG